MKRRGIIKSGVPVITGVQDEEALQVIQKCCKGKSCKLIRDGQPFYSIT